MRGPPFLQQNQQRYQLLVQKNPLGLLQKNVLNPVEILRYAQGCIVTRRKLDVQNFTDSIEGDTNYILINRHDVLGTAIEEIQATENPRNIFLLRKHSWFRRPEERVF